MTKVSQCLSVTRVGRVIASLPFVSSRLAKERGQRPGTKVSTGPINQWPLHHTDIISCKSPCMGPDANTVIEREHVERKGGAGKWGRGGQGSEVAARAGEKG